MAVRVRFEAGVGLTISKLQIRRCHRCRIYHWRRGVWPKIA